MFKIADGRDSFWQWDINRSIIVSDNTIKEVHFCNKTDDCSLVVEVDANPTDSELYADVPNILLQNDFPIRVYAYCEDGYTKIEKTFKVITRSKPADYIYTETEVKRWEDLEHRIDEKIIEADSKIAEIDDADKARNEAYEAFKNDISNSINIIDSKVDDSLDVIYTHSIRLDNMEERLPTSAFYTDATMKNKKDIPKNACKWVKLNELGSITQRTTNLLPFPYANTSTKYGNLTITVNEDGSVTRDSNNQKLTTAYTFILYEGKIPLKAGSRYISSGCAALTNYNNVIDSNGYFQAQAGEHIVQISMYSPAGAKYSSSNPSHTLYPQINEGQTVLAYTKGTADGLLYSKVTMIHLLNTVGNNVLYAEIPKEITSIKGYGESNPDDATEYNKLDLTSGIFTAIGYIENGIWIPYSKPINYDVSDYVKALRYISLETGYDSAFVRYFEIIFSDDEANRVISSLTYTLKE